MWRLASSAWSQMISFEVWSHLQSETPTQSLRLLSFTDEAVEIGHAWVNL